jgi:hypothetical protein
MAEVTLFFFPGLTFMFFGRKIQYGRSCSHKSKKLRKIPGAQEKKTALLYNGRRNGLESTQGGA